MLFIWTAGPPAPRITCPPPPEECKTRQSAQVMHIKVSRPKTRGFDAVFWAICFDGAASPKTGGSAAYWPKCTEKIWREFSSLLTLSEYPSCMGFSVHGLSLFPTRSLVWVPGLGTGLRRVNPATNKRTDKQTNKPTNQQTNKQAIRDKQRQTKTHEQTKKKRKETTTKRRDKTRKEKQHRKRKTKRKENITNDVGPRAGGVKQHKGNQSVEVYLCQTAC